MTDREQSCDAINCRPEVVAVAFFGRSGMQSHAHEHAADCRKIGALQLSLRIPRGCNCIPRGHERRAKCIADRLEDVPAMCRDCRAQQRIVTRQRRIHRITIALPPLRAALDVREEKRDGAGRVSSGRRARVELTRHPQEASRQGAPVPEVKPVRTLAKGSETSTHRRNARR